MTCFDEMEHFCSSFNIKNKHIFHSPCEQKQPLHLYYSRVHLSDRNTVHLSKESRLSGRKLLLCTEQTTKSEVQRKQNVVNAPQLHLQLFLGPNENILRQRHSRKIHADCSATNMANIISVKMKSSL